jgi:hydrogenase maturation factor
MHRTGQAETDKCPACQHIVETDWHIMSCTRRTLWREELLCTLGDTLRINHTQPDLIIILLQGIRGAFSDQRYQMHTHNREHRF